MPSFYNHENSRRHTRLYRYDYPYRDCISSPSLHRGVRVCLTMLARARWWYRELARKFPDKRCHYMVVMPNLILLNVAVAGVTWVDETWAFAMNTIVFNDDMTRPRSSTLTTPVSNEPARSSFIIFQRFVIFPPR